MPDIPLQDQIKCVEREIAMRRRVYPRWVFNNKMKQGQADREIERMEAVLNSLQTLQTVEAIEKL